MPDVYRSGEAIPEIGGPIEGGTTIVVHRPEEVGGLIALAALAGRPPEDPMAAIARELQVGSVDLEAWKRWERRSVLPEASPMYDMKPNDDPAEGETDDPAELLQVMLSEARAVWLAHDEADRRDLALLMTVADPVASGQPTLVAKPERPALLMHPGSRNAQIVKGPLTIATFVVGFALGGGVTPSHRVTGLVRRTRARALQASPPPERLHDLTDRAAVTTEALSNSNGLVVFVHGLFATDVGTFDRLCRLTPAGFVLAGFPHNSLDSIEDNAHALASAIRGALDGLSIPVFLICHSRGGLVARRAAVWLFEEDKKRWTQMLRLCVTFGTPHEGAELAEAPGQLLAALVMYGGRRAASVCSLVDVLAVWNEHDGLPGIDELKPRRAGNVFLRQLQDKEGLSPLLPLLAIGGEATRGWLWNRLLGEGPHDHIVLRESAIPSFLKPGDRIHTKCDHFSYFEEDQRGTLDKVIERIVTLAALPKEERVRVPASKAAVAGG